MGRKNQKKEVQLPGRLKQWRQRSGLTQTELSKLLGYKTSQFVSNWEKGRSSPPLDVVSHLIEIFGVSQGEFVEVMLHDTRLMMEKKIADSRSEGRRRIS